MSMDVSFPDDVWFKKGFEEVCGKMLETVQDDITSGVKSAVRASIRHSGDSETVNSVRTYKPEMTKDRTAMKVRCTFSGNSKSGKKYHTVSRGKARIKAVSNANKAFWLEYGVAGRQAPRPWRDKAVSSMEPKIAAKLQTEFEKIMGAD